MKNFKKWYRLKNVVSDWKTFRLMSEEGLREELLFYWKMLGSDPLYVSDKAEQDAKAQQLSKFAVSENAQILSEMDSADVLHLSEREMKAIKFKGKSFNKNVM